MKKIIFLVFLLFNINFNFNVNNSIDFSKGISHEFKDNYIYFYINFHKFFKFAYSSNKKEEFDNLYNSIFNHIKDKNINEIVQFDYNYGIKNIYKNKEDLFQFRFLKVNKKENSSFLNFFKRPEEIEIEEIFNIKDFFNKNFSYESKYEYKNKFQEYFINEIKNNKIFEEKPEMKLLRIIRNKFFIGLNFIKSKTKNLYNYLF